ncbi:abasic site processing protein HMCES [Arctopsyche grandis]|uniref:abasic site processing protein HMCES n=1 Tax=Arctopsyche grandis TaxID=121162 RepID=UPI00406D8AAA
MCGRTGLTLGPNDIVKACCYKKKNETKFSKPTWSDEKNLEKKYNPSYNIAPTDVTPILILSKEERIVKPMMWGMVPPWHKGDYKKHGLSTNNCRIENILTSKLFKEPLQRGNRCVILAEGFYEWKTTDKSKQPYYIYCKQDDSIKVHDMNSWNNSFDENDGWQGIQLLKMAGIYNVWNCDDGDLYSYSIITMESNDTLGWLHHRMPAILESEDDVAKWLDTESISPKDSISFLKATTNLTWHMVSTNVNNSRYKSEDCNNPANPNDKKSVKKTNTKNVGSVNLMNSWLKRKSPLKNELPEKKFC